MRLGILADVDWQSKIDRTVLELADFKFRQHFEPLDYGEGLAGLTVIFMCRDPAHNFKRRLKLSKKERSLYMDIMLDLESMKSATPEARKREVAQRLFDEVPEVLSGYKITNFNRDAFVADLQAWINSTGWR